MAEHWIDKLTSSEVIRFLEEHENLDEQAFLLRHETCLGIPSKILAAQIKGRRKAKEKLPHWFQTPGMIFLPSVALEQCSSETTALYRLDRIRNFLDDRPRRAADITGGFGVDTYYLGTVFAGTDYVEPEASLLEIAQHNHRQLGAVNISYHHTSAENFLTQSPVHFDLIFADPSRKTVKHAKAVKLQDCLPDITKLQQSIYEHARLFLLKASPLLDIKEALRQLYHVAEINVVAVDNEVRELLFVGMRGHKKDEPLIRAVNLSGKSRDEFVFTLTEEARAEVTHSAPLTFLYEPYRCVLKAGAFRLAALRYGLKKLHANTHLYTGDKLIEDFPGRIFRITGEIGSNETDAARAFSGKKANIIIRNYPSTASSLAKKFKIQEGGTDYLIACISVKKRHLLAAQRLK